MPNVTVTGPSATILTVPFTGTANYVLASQLAAIINQSASGSNLSAYYAGSTPGVGGVSEEVVTTSGAVTTPAGTNFLTDDASGAVTVQGSPFVNVIAGTGGLTFFGATSGNTSIAAGGGNSTIGLPNGSSYYAALGPGADTVYANGAGTVDASGGGGANLIFTSQYSNNQNVIYSAGTGDTIIAGAGNTSIGESGSNATIYLGTGNDMVFGAGTNDTVVGSTVSGTSATLFGGAKDVVFGNAEAITYVASASGAASVLGTGNDAIVGNLNTTLTLGSGADTLEFFKGGTSGTDLVTGFTSSDSLDTFGYGGTPTVTSAGGSTTVTLGDGTKITLAGFSGNTGFVKGN